VLAIDTAFECADEAAPTGRRGIDIFVFGIGDESFGNGTGGRGLNDIGIEGNTRRSLDVEGDGGVGRALENRERPLPNGAPEYFDSSIWSAIVLDQIAAAAGFHGPQ